MNRLALAIATVLGCGYFPIAPGTIGSLAGLAVAVLIARLGNGRLFLFVLVIISVPIAMWSASIAARLLGRKDPGQVVVDEVLGQWITLLGASIWNWKVYLAAFIAFRLFDVWKPPPVRNVESLPGGVGIVADDLLAGIYGALIVYVGARLKII